MRTINIKLITIPFFIFYFSFFTPLRAQTDDEKKAMCNSYLKATFIFEGRVVSSKYFTIKTGEHTYDNFIAYFVEIKKVIKGNIQTGTIEIMDPAPGIIYKGDNDILTSGQSSDGRNGIVSQGLYFCWDKEINMTKSYFKNSNTKTLRYFTGVFSTDGEIKNDPNVLDIGTYFSTFSDFYNFLNANLGIKFENK
jgi:hypothetical protein